MVMTAGGWSLSGRGCTGEGGVGFERWYGGITNGRMWSRRDEGEGALGYSLVVACMTD